MKDKTLDRRNFLKTTAAVGTLGISGYASAQKNKTTAASVKRRLGANDRIRVGTVGLGVRGSSLSKSVLNLAQDKSINVELAAVCDAWRVNRERVTAELDMRTSSKLQSFDRHEAMLEKVELDAVLIATPDFWHVPVLLDSLKAGKDAYIEKPMGVTLEEAKAARAAVRAAGAVVQVGTQRRSDDKFYASREFIRSGQLGKISTIEGAFNDCSPRWRRESLCKQMKESDIDWKYYLRDREYRPFNPRHLLEWKLFRDFTMGTSGLLGCHMYDAIHLVMDVQYPISAVSQGGVYVYKDGREVEDTFITLLEYSQEFVVNYMTRLGNRAGHGIRARGVRGTLDVERCTYSGEGGQNNNQLSKQPVKLKTPEKRRPSHMENFLNCMRTRKDPAASIDVGYQHMVVSVMAQQAMIEKRRLVYDPKKDRII